MNRAVVLLLVLVLLLTSFIAIANLVSSIYPGTWTSKASMQVARSTLGVAVVNGKIYAIGGITDGAEGINEEYDPATDMWTFKKSMPTPRLNFAIASYQNKIYCIGGTSNGIAMGVNEVYDPATDTWENKTASPTARSYITANVVNGKIYIIGGGGDTNGTINEFYDPATDSWSAKSPMPAGVYGYVSAVVGNKIYVIDSTLNQIYDVETDTWSQGASPPSRIWYGKAGATTGVNALKRIYVFGSGTENFCVNQVYDPQHDRWTVGAGVPTLRRSFAVAVVNDMLYVIGGFTVTYTEPLNWHSSVRTLYATNEQYAPFGYGRPDPTYVPPIECTAPEIDIVSPVNQTYNVSSVPLVFTANKPINWVGYSLNGQDNVTVAGNTTLSELPIGVYSLMVYATDLAGNTGASETVTFTVNVPKTFPIVPVAASGSSIVLVVAAGLLYYFRKRRQPAS